VSNVVPFASRKQDPFALSEEDDDGRVVGYQSEIPGGEGSTITSWEVQPLTVSLVKVHRPYDPKKHGPRSWKMQVDVPEFWRPIVAEAIGFDTNPFTSQRSFIVAALGLMAELCLRAEQNGEKLGFITVKQSLDHLQFMEERDTDAKRLVDGYEDQIDTAYKNRDLRSAKQALEILRAQVAVMLASPDEYDPASKTMQDAKALITQWDRTLTLQ